MSQIHWRPFNLSDYASPVHELANAENRPLNLSSCSPQVHFPSGAASATLALPRRLEAVPDGKWTCGEQLDKFKGLFFAFVSSWTGLAQADKLKGRQCISLKSKCPRLAFHCNPCWWIQRHVPREQFHQKHKKEMEGLLLTLCFPNHFT